MLLTKMLKTNESSHLVKAMTQILRVDRTSEAIQDGLSLLSDAPVADLAKALLIHRTGPAIFILSGFKDTPERWRQKPLYHLLKDHYILSEMRLKLARKFSAEIIGRLNAAGIQPLLMKGILLAELLYPDPAMRHFNDLDLVVRPEEYPKACDALSDFQKIHEDQAFHTFATFITDSSAELDLQFAIELHNCGEIVYNSPVNKLLKLDFHHEMGKVYATSELVVSPFGKIRTINERLILPFLCSHYTTHLFRASAKLMGLFDIALLLHKFSTSIEWEKILSWQSKNSSGSNANAGNALYPPLFLASRWLGAPVPDEIMKSVTAITVRPIQRRTEKEAKTFGAVAFGDKRRHTLLSYRWWLSLRQSCRLLISAVFPSPQQLREYKFLERVNIISGYARWYRHVWRCHVKPTLRSLLQKNQKMLDLITWIC